MKTIVCIVSGGVAALGAAAAQSGGVYADDITLYGRLSAGVSSLEDSQNAGILGQDFVTGEGTTIPAGTALPGAAVGWTTEFDPGFFISGAAGADMGAFRLEGELSWRRNDVDTHAGVTAAGIDLSGEDAGVLIAGSGNIGATVADVVAAGEGSVSELGLFANGYYDFKNSSLLTPYVGVGVGVAFVDVDYSPSGVTIVEDEQAAFAYQAMAGASFAVTPRAEFYAGYRYRATPDVEVDTALFPGVLEIENQAHLAEAGLRITF